LIASIRSTSFPAEEFQAQGSDFPVNSDKDLMGSQQAVLRRIYTGLRSESYKYSIAFKILYKRVKVKRIIRVREPIQLSFWQLVIRSFKPPAKVFEILETVTAPGCVIHRQAALKLDDILHLVVKDAAEGLQRSRTKGPFPNRQDSQIVSPPTAATGKCGIQLLQFEVVNVISVNGKRSVHWKEAGVWWPKSTKTDLARRCPAC
jgi:hypothetical protein